MQTFKLRIANGTDNGDEKSLLILNAEMEAFEILLNSAKDDLPLFMMKMCDAKIRFRASKDTEENQEAIVSLGDFRLEVPRNSKILNQYSTILGLASQVSSSLLCLEYVKGPLAVRTSSLESVNQEDTEMIIDVSLSPMRFVHVQAQILTLVEYLTEGVLGTVTKRVATSAAQAAYELSQKQLRGRNIIHVKASGFDFVLPQASYSKEFFALHIGKMLVHFTAFPNPGEGEAVIALEKVTMKCNRDELIIYSPIRMDIHVSLAPLSAPTLDDQATRIILSTSRAEFILTHRHYTQVMKTLESNIGEANSFLRDELSERRKANKMSTNAKKFNHRTSSLTLTHGGAEEVLIRKRMFMTFKFEELILELRDEINNDPILSINAVTSSILMRLFPHEETMEVDATLHDLVVQDRRLFALNRHFRKLVRQVEDKTSDPDVFKLQYFQSKIDQIQRVNIDLGRAQVVFIPDLIVQTLEFFKREDEPPQAIKLLATKSSGSFRSFDESFSISDISDTSPKLKTINFKLKTADFRLVLIDMGTITSSNISSIKSSKPTEAIVLQGQTEATAELVTDFHVGNLIRNGFEVHGENFEIYTAEGETLASPVQVMNPIRFSAFFSTKLKNKIQLVDMSFVTLSAVHVTLSMQNVSLLTAIFSSTVEAWTNEKIDQNYQKIAADKPLSQDMLKEIQKVSTALEEKDDTETTSLDPGAELVFRDGVVTAPPSAHSSASNDRKKRISMKMTLPETTLILVNDLQGLDDALFKVTLQSCVWGGDASMDRMMGKDSTIFHVHTNTNILADYFDSHTKLWEPFLLKPWEIDFKAARGKKEGTPRFTTTLDIESHPCQLSFSEQFIISLRGASSMWTLYSQTTRKAMDILSRVNKHRHTVSFAQARASFSARAMTTTMPYGIENRTGYEITFNVNQCREQAINDYTSYFNFNLPQGDGVGGYRSYGQDCISKKSIDIFIDGNCIHFDHIDDELNRPKKAHKLDGCRFVFSEVIKIGKATVSHHDYSAIIVTAYAATHHHHFSIQQKIIQVTSFMNILNETVSRMKNFLISDNYMINSFFFQLI